MISVNNSSHLMRHYCFCILILMIPTYHPAGRALNSDWSMNSFIMIIHEKIVLVMLRTENSDWTLKYFIIDDHFKTISIVWTSQNWMFFLNTAGADPGFPLGGCTNPPGGANIRCCQIFAKNCMKLRKFWAGSVRQGRSPKSATAQG